MPSSTFGHGDYEKCTVLAARADFHFSNFAYLYKKILNFANIQSTPTVGTAIERGRMGLLYKNSKASTPRSTQKDTKVKIKKVTELGARWALAGVILGTFCY
uniref:Uncharacterized protein n=1 Tax=Photinus pyralis TaxID=7054 RepID=A0A1Y1LY24_PHOPY